jgi:hypothetical protein
VDESVENNNTVVLPYRWEPVTLASDAPQTLSRGPKRNPLSYTTVALDGYGNGGGFGGWWDVAAVMPSASADYDIFLYNTDPTPTTGWNSPVATSAYVSQVDFVGSNNNAVGDADFIGVVNYSDSADNYTVERQASIGIGNPPAAPALVGSYGLAAGEILDVYEMYATASSPIWFNFDVTSGSADIAVFIFGPTSTYFSRGGAAWTLNGGGAGADEAGIFTPSATGWHGIVVCKNLRTDLANSADYNFYWGSPAGDLTYTALSGWSAPLVARNGGTVGVLPAILNEGASFGDSGLTNIGAGTMPAGSNLSFFLDGPQVYTSGDFVALAPGAISQISNRSLGTVKGGRHELASVLDVNNEIVEQPPNGEINNAVFTQYVWAPYALANNTPLSRTAVPNWANTNNGGYYLQPSYNQDGYLYTTSYWTGVAAIPTNPAMQYYTENYGYASTDVINGLIGPNSIETNGPGRINLMMANGNVLGNGQNYNLGVMNYYSYPGVPSVGNYTVQLSHRRSDLTLSLPVSATLLGGASGGEIVHTYDIYLYAGTSYPLTLFNNSGVDLGVSVFSAGQNFVARLGALATFDANGAGADEAGSFTPSVTGWHGVAVYRGGSSDLGPAAPYVLVIGNWAPAAPLNLDITMTETDGSDNYLWFSLQWNDVTVDSNGAPLTVDHYNAYWSFDAYGSWYFISSPVASELLNEPAYIGIQPDLYFMVTAVDENGTLLASSRPVTGPLPDPAAAPVTRLAGLPAGATAPPLGSVVR